MTWETIQPYLGIGEGQMHWIVKVFIVVFITLTLNFIVGRLLLRIDDKLQRTRTPWDNMIVEAAIPPLRLFIWLIGLSIAAQISEKQLDEEFITIIAKVREIGVIAIIAWFLLRCVKGIEATLISGRASKAVDYTTASAISKLLRAAVIITAALVILQNLGYSISGVLAFGGIGGIAVGFAAKDLLANFFGGLMVYLDRPFKVGDWIRSPDKNIEGTVEHIGWRQTRIRTFDMRPLYVPNATFSTISVENPSRMSHRRINESVGVRYNDFGKLATILDDIKDMVGNHPEIDNSQIYMVNFNQFGPSSLDFFIYAYTRTTSWAKYHEVKQDVLFQAMQIIEQHGAEVAFPTRTLHLFNEQQDSEEFIADQSAAAAKPKLSARHSRQNGNQNQADTSQVGDAESN
ncbi:Low conductance mechanosensitive channel YnaI [Marinomonas aquimarina]|uniref:Low conductance mechanosensitive channel YnaI n=1 Tax=Marinomonas aquimarina TaxID=295068 RepID=A0A1A8TLV6_9GAMM|nr:mechanosensitive ion channel family protein [Marinomonas aquimarina]SBS33799.1 Low conductance mechanosensitive channel YnaI [Marinomonas aquimarina]